jgi:hypothetical protein
MMVMRRHLQAACNKIPARRRRAWWASGLVGLLLALLVAGSVATVHGHDGSGLYDEECPLVWLAVGKPGVPFPSVPILAPLAPAPDPVPAPLAAELADASFASFDPRAPPPQTLLSVLAH